MKRLRSINRPRRSHKEKHFNMRGNNMTQKFQPRPLGLYRLAIALAVTIFLAVTVFHTTPTHAQALGTGSISGTVQDQSGAVVTGATVTVTNIATNAKIVQKTSSSGAYAIQNVPEGDYNVDIKASGFASFEQQVHVEALNQVGLNINLKVGASSEKVEISAEEQPLLDTENGTVEDVIPAETYDDLPVGVGGGSKSPIAYLTLTPGVTSNGTSAMDSTNNYTFNGGIDGSSQLYINGLPEASSEYQGGWETIGNTTYYDVQSFQTITSGIPAYYDGQGIGNLVYKSGTNQVHADIYENNRNTAFDAAQFFAPYSNGHLVRGVEHQNEYGIAGGGPFVKNRIWGFGSYDHYGQSGTGSTGFSTVPTTLAQGGDFSGGYQAIYDPNTTTCDESGNCTRTAFPGNKINRAFSPVDKYLETAPGTLPQVTGPLTNNISVVQPGGSLYWNEFGKVDWKVTQKNTLSADVRYAHGRSLFTGQNLPAPYGSNRIGSGSAYWSGQLNDTQVLSNSLVNIFALGFNRSGGVESNPSDGTNWTTKAGITGLPVGSSLVTQFPFVSFAGGNVTPTAWEDADPDFAEIVYSEVAQDNMQWIKRNHAFTFGGQILLQYEQLDQAAFWGGNGLQFTNQETGQFCPANGVSPVNGAKCPAGTIDPATGDPYASFLLGLVNNSALDDNTVNITGGRWKNYALWAQDDWKLTRKLTVNLGVRYTIPRPFTEAHDRWSDFNPNRINPVTGTPGVVQFGGFDNAADCFCHSDVQTHYLTFGPRIGFAYGLDDKTVVRSSFAIVHFNGGILGGNGTQQGPGVLGFSSDPAWSSTIAGTPAFIIDNGFQNPTIYPGTDSNTSYTVPPFFSSTLNTGYTTTPGFTGQTSAGFEYDRPATSARAPYTEGWNLTIERQLPSAFVVALTYAGTSSHFDGMDGGVGIFSNQVQPSVYQLPGMGALLNQQYNAVDPVTSQTYLAEAQAIYPGAKLPYANFAGTVGQLLRPFPQYGTSGPVWNGNPDSFSDFGTNAYNGLQATITHQMRNGLYLFGSYAWSKEIDTAGATVQFFEQNARSAYDWNLERAPGLEDTPQFFSFVEDYELPIGKGKLVNIDNNVADSIIGGWKISGAENYSAGNPFTPVVGTCTANNYGGTLDAIGFGSLHAGCYDDYNKAFTGSVKKAKIGSGNPRTDAYFDYHAFDYGATTTTDPTSGAVTVVEAASASQLAPYSLGDTPRTLPYSSMRGEWYKNENVSLTKTFPFPFFFGEKASFVFRADALNVFNRAIFNLSGGGSMNAAAGEAGSFGHVTGQENGPRFLQFEGHIRF
jgi:hypothetical protein